mmetsp:Transcript_107472/g.167904  ORF Transcript_107472/g.167904 Transcript_107472/m.167904 type:complete len:559 (-) Transcript_107472:84-1760(-)
MVGAAEGSDTLWVRLDSEVKRLTANRIKGKHFSEDFVVDRVCTLLNRLREQSDRKVDVQIEHGPANESKPEDLTALRAALEGEQQKLQTLQAEVEQARSQVQEAKNARAELDREWDREREKQHLAREKHARTWKETALRSQLCQARLKAMEHEGTQLRAALGQPETLAKVWDGLLTKLQAELDVANVEVAEAKREHERLSTELSRKEKANMPVANSEDSVRENSLMVNSDGVKKATQQLSFSKARPILSLTSNREMGKVLDTTARPEMTQSVQLSAVSASEAPYSTASILNDARRALEKLEQLKVRRVGSLSHSPQVGATTAPASAMSPNAQVTASLRGPLRQASSLSPTTSRLPQRPLMSIGTSPAPSAQPPVQTLSATPAPTQTLSASPTPTARTSAQAQQSQSHIPAPQHLAAPTVGATPFRPGMVQAKDFGQPLAKATPLQASPLQRPPSFPQQRISSVTPPTTGAAKVSSPLPAARSGSPTTSSSNQISRLTARSNVTLSSTSAMPTTPDAASRLASLAASRVAPKQVAPVALMARSTTGSLQEYGNRPQLGR